MKITLDPKKSLHQNAATYFEKAKEAKAKRASVISAMAALHARLDALEEKRAKLQKEAIAKDAPKLKVSRKREWFEAFHFFTTTGGLLCIGGRDAKQNEVAVARHLQEGDLFFHADIQGAPATILKGGVGASEGDKQEAAQFAASFSSAWKRGFSSVDVYAVGRDQVSKHAESGEFVPKGGFIIRGKREWFKNTELKLAVGTSKAEPASILIVPAIAKPLIDSPIEISPNEKKKNADEVCHKLKLDAARREELMHILP